MSLVSDCPNGFWLPQWFLISPIVSDFPNGFWFPQWFLISPMVSDCPNGFRLPQWFLIASMVSDCLNHFPHVIMINVTEEGYTDSDYPFDIFKLFVFQKRVVHANCISTFVFYITGSILYTTAGGLLVT